MYLIDTMSEVQRLFVRTFKVHICRKSFNLTTIYHMLFFPGLSLFVMTHCKYQRELFLNLSSELHWVTKLIIREKWTSLNVEFFKLKMNVTQNSSNAGNVTGLSEEPVQLNSDDATWILTSAFIIFTMQSGFGLVESGLYSFFFTFQLKFPVFDNIPICRVLATRRKPAYTVPFQRHQNVEWSRVWYLMYKEIKENHFKAEQMTLIRGEVAKMCPFQFCFL